MQYAIKDNIKIEAMPKMEAICPLCNEIVVSKCGKIKIWHWAHRNLKDCDNWFEPETQWHRDWKARFPEECREVTIGKHRADVKHKGKVFEFQNSSISYEQVKEREQFYGNMCWIINMKEKNNFIVRDSKYDKNGNLYYTFRWKWCSKIWKYSTKPKYIDTTDGLFMIYKIYDNNYGAGKYLYIDEFIG